MRTGGPPQHCAVAKHRARKVITCTTPNDHDYRCLYVRIAVMSVSGVPLIYIMTLWKEKLASSRAGLDSRKSQDEMGGDRAKSSGIHASSLNRNLSHRSHICFVGPEPSVLPRPLLLVSDWLLARSGYSVWHQDGSNWRRPVPNSNKHNSEHDHNKSWKVNPFCRESFHEVAESEYSVLQSCHSNLAGAAET